MVDTNGGDGGWGDESLVVGDSERGIGDDESVDAVVDRSDGICIEGEEAIDPVEVRGVFFNCREEFVATLGASGQVDDAIFVDGDACSPEGGMLTDGGQELSVVVGSLQEDCTSFEDVLEQWLLDRFHQGLDFGSVIKIRMWGGMSIQPPG